MDGQILSVNLGRSCSPSRAVWAKPRCSNKQPVPWLNRETNPKASFTSALSILYSNFLNLPPFRQNQAPGTVSVFTPLLGSDPHFRSASCSHKILRSDFA